MDDVAPSHAQRMDHFRLSVIGPLLAAPPQPRQLRERLLALAATPYTHPVTGVPLYVSFSTLERWFYAVRRADDPIGKLRKRVRCDYKTHRVVPEKIQALITVQAALHKDWTLQLLYDNVAILAVQQADVGRVPSYPTFVRFMRGQGWRRQRRPRRAAQAEALAHHATREIRSFEVEYVHALWHLDYHTGSLRIATPSGTMIAPLLLCILDDCSRVVCHAQWYWGETAQHLVHGLSQALQKRGLPRALMSDNGSAMTAAETTGGLQRLGILHKTTLPYSPHQNGKQERFWGQVEGRLLPMVADKPGLTLDELNAATAAWVELEYHQKLQSELKQTPLERLCQTQRVDRACPPSEALRQAFTQQVTRKVRRNDGTLTVQGVRFELPQRFVKTMGVVTVAYARWDLRHVWLIEPRKQEVLATLYPLDKGANADAVRRTTAVVNDAPPQSTDMAPLLAELMRRYAQTGLPPPYLAFDELADSTDPTPSTSLSLERLP
jgi:putative transposase